MPRRPRPDAATELQDMRSSSDAARAALDAGDVAALARALRAALAEGRARVAGHLVTYYLATPHLAWSSAPDTTAERAQTARELLGDARHFRRLDWRTAHGVIDRLLGMLPDADRQASVDALWAGRAALPCARHDRWVVFSASCYLRMRAAMLAGTVLSEDAVRHAWQANDVPNLAFLLMQQPHAPVDPAALVAVLQAVAEGREGRETLHSTSVSPWPAAPRPAGAPGEARSPLHPWQRAEDARGRPMTSPLAAARLMPWLTVAAGLLARPDVPTSVLTPLGRVSVGTRDPSYRDGTSWLRVVAQNAWVQVDPVVLCRRLDEGLCPPEVAQEVRLALYDQPGTPPAQCLALAAQLLTDPGGVAVRDAVARRLDEMSTVWPGPDAPQMRAAWTVLLHQGARPVRLAALARFGAQTPETAGAPAVQAPARPDGPRARGPGR